MGIAPTPSVVTLPPREPAPSLLDFFDRRFPRVGREVWRRRLAEGKVLDERGAAVTLETPYAAGRRLRYFREVEVEPVVPLAEEVLWAGEHLVVADKPPFLPVHPTGPYVSECLLHRLRRRTGRGDLAPLHRLDRETAGLVLFSARRDSRPLYHQLFDRGEIDREYRAVARVAAEPRRRRWRLESRLVRGEPWFRMRETPGPPNARTAIELVDRRVGWGLFRLRPESGKKHQLRLHMAALGFPIAGDRLYPDLAPPAADDLSRPLALVAHRLAFRDPVSGEAVAFTTRRRLDWPPDAR